MAVPFQDIAVVVIRVDNIDVMLGKAQTSVANSR